MPTLIICLDGLGYDFLSKQNTPYLYQLAKQNSLAKLKTLLAFTGIEFSFFSGKYPNQHNIWLEFVYSPKTSPFKLVKYSKFLGRRICNYIFALYQYFSGRTQLSKLYNIPTNIIDKFDIATKHNIWKLDLFQKQNFVCYKWPFLVKQNKIQIDPLYKNDSFKCQELIKNISPKINLYSIHLTDLDKVVHKYGIKHVETIKKIRKLDLLTKKLITRFRKKIKNLNIIIWSDHGFVPVKKYINLQSILPKSKNYTAFFGGTTTSFWFKNNEIKNKITKKLQKLKFGHILTEAERKKYKIPEARKHGEVIFLMNPGYNIFPNYYQKSEHEKFKTMHGYAPDKCNHDGFLIINKKINKKVLNMVDVIKWI